MRRLVLLLVIPLSLTGCGERKVVEPSTLQRFDDLRYDLRRVGAESGSVARDMQVLDWRMQSDDVPGARREAVKLKVDAASFRRHAGKTGNAVRKLVSAEHNRKLSTYYRLAVQVLALQWAEGQQLERLADLAWADPLMLDSRHEHRLWVVEGRARADAAAAATYAGRAAAWRWRFPRAFRYTPVNQRAQTKRSGAG